MGDAQSFKHADGSKPLCFLSDAKIMHYGWARKSTIMKAKVQSFDKLYHGKDYKGSNEFEYQRMWGLKRFEGTHPIVMQKWIAENKNDLDVLKLKLNFTVKDLKNDLLLDFNEKTSKLKSLKVKS